MLVTGQAYQDPKDALNEFVSNAADDYAEAVVGDTSGDGDGIASQPEFPATPPGQPTAVTIALAASSWASSAASIAPTMVKKPWIIPSKRRCWVGTPAASSAAA